MKLKQTLKIVSGVFIFLTLPSILFFGFLYFKYHEDLPSGVQGEQADRLASKMMNALNYGAFKTTDYIEFTYKKRHHYKWHKSKKTCEVYWKNYKVILDFNNDANSKAFKNEQEVTNVDLIQKAYNYFNNDIFWLIAPYKLFDQGVERRLVKIEDNKEALLVTYISGDYKPGESYLWYLDNNGKPERFKMWTSNIPINGLEASWSDWKTTETGAILSSFHKILFFGFEIDDIKTFNKN